MSELEIIAKQLQRLNLPWMPGMATISGLRILGDITNTGAETSGGWCSNKELGVPDLNDDATFALVELWLRNLGLEGMSALPQSRLEAATQQLRLAQAVKEPSGKACPKTSELLENVESATRKLNAYDLARQIAVDIYYEPTAEKLASLTLYLQNPNNKWRVETLKAIGDEEIEINDPVLSKTIYNLLENDDLYIDCYEKDCLRQLFPR